MEGLSLLAYTLSVHPIMLLR